MAVRIPRASLTETQVDAVVRHLVLQPKDNNFHQRRNCFSNKGEEPIQFFYFDQTTNDVVIPYTFYRGLTGHHPNADRPYPVVPHKFTGTLYEAQAPIAENALKHLHQHGTTTLNLYTAFGKTVVGSYLSSQLGLITLILYKSTILEPQWKSTYEEFTDAKIWVVGEDPPPGGAHVILCMDTRFSKLPQSYVDQIGTVIIDEAHEFCTPGRVGCLLGTRPRYVIASTATLVRKDGMHVMMQSICGLHKVEKISQKPFIAYKFRTGIEIPIIQNMQGTPDWSAFCNAQSANEERNTMILDIIRRNPEFKILVLTWRADHVDLLEGAISKMGISVDKMSRNKKRYSDSQVLVGTISKIGTGFDEKAACDNFNGFRINLLLLVGSMRSVQLLEQVAGRCFRADFPQIIYFVDQTKISENHWKVAQPWFKSRNGTIYEIISENAAAAQRVMEPDYVEKASSSLARAQSLEGPSRPALQLQVIGKGSTSSVGTSSVGTRINVLPSTAPDVPARSIIQDNTPSVMPQSTEDLQPISVDPTQSIAKQQQSLQQRLRAQQDQASSQPQLVALPQMKIIPQLPHSQVPQQPSPQQSNDPRVMAHIARIRKFENS